MKQQTVKASNFELLQDAALPAQQQRAVKGGAYTLQPGDVIVEVIDPATRRCRIRLANGEFIVVDVVIDGN